MRKNSGPSFQIWRFGWPHGFSRMKEPGRRIRRSNCAVVQNRRSYPNAAMGWDKRRPCFGRGQRGIKLKQEIQIRTSDRLLEKSDGKFPVQAERIWDIQSPARELARRSADKNLRCRRRDWLLQAPPFE